MPISVTCGSCSAQYYVPDTLAGKRAKCKQCGGVVSVPAEDNPLLDPAINQLAAAPLPKPLPVASARPAASKPVPSAAATAAAWNQAHGADIDRLSRPVVKTGPTDAERMLAIIVSPLVTLGVGGFTFAALMCTGNFWFGMVLLGVGIVAAVYCFAVGIGRQTKIAWSVCGSYAAICLVGSFIKVGIDSYNRPSRELLVARPVVVNPNQQQNNVRPNINNNAPLVSDQAPWEDPRNLTNNNNASNTNNGNTQPRTPRTPLDPDRNKPRLLGETPIHFNDWHVVVDPAPHGFQVGPGRELTVTVQSSYSLPRVILPESYGRAFAIDHGISQGLEVWDMAGRKKLAQLPRLGIVTRSTISPDGQLLAGIVFVDKLPKLRVWSTANGRESCTIDPGLNDKDRYEFGFAGPLVLYTLRYAEMENSVLQLWSSATGAKMLEVPLDGVAPYLRNVVVTPGGRFLAAAGKQVTFWDAQTGEQAGQLELPEGWKCTGASFSPKGDELALLLDDDRHGQHFGVWNLDKQELVAGFDYKSQFDSPFRQIGKFELYWRGNNEGWLIGKKQIDRATGEEVGEFAEAFGEDNLRVMFDADQLLDVKKTGNNYWNITVSAFDANKLKAGREEKVAGSAFPGLPRGSQRDPANFGPMPQLYEELLAAEPDSWKNHWQWCAGLGRPVVGTRFGVGMWVNVTGRDAQLALQPELANPESLEWLENQAGPIGAQVVDMLREKGNEGKLGGFFDLKDARVKDVIILGGGERPQLADSARRANVDVALLIRLEPVVMGKNRDISMNLQMIDMATTKKLWESKSLLSSKATDLRNQGQDPLADLVKSAGRFIDDDLKLTPLSTMPKPTIAERAVTQPLHRTNPMAALAELLLYTHHKAITKDVSTAALAKLTGNAADAAKLVGDDAAAKKSTIEKYADEW